MLLTPNGIHKMNMPRNIHIEHRTRAHLLHSPSSSSSSIRIENAYHSKQPAASDPFYLPFDVRSLLFWSHSIQAKHEQWWQRNRIDRNPAEKMLNAVTFDAHNNDDDDGPVWMMMVIRRRIRRIDRLKTNEYNANEKPASHLSRMFVNVTSCNFFLTLKPLNLNFLQFARLTTELSATLSRNITIIQLWSMQAFRRVFFYLLSAYFFFIHVASIKVESYSVNTFFRLFLISSKRA